MTQKRGGIAYICHVLDQDREILQLGGHSHEALDCGGGALIVLVVRCNDYRKRLRHSLQ